MHARLQPLTRGTCLQRSQSACPPQLLHAPPPLGHLRRLDELPEWDRSHSRPATMAFHVFPLSSLGVTPCRKYTARSSQPMPQTWNRGAAQRRLVQTGSPRPHWWRGGRTGSQGSSGRPNNTSANAGRSCPSPWCAAGVCMCVGAGEVRGWGWE